ncbi:MAG: YceD family protein [Alphaproteobacteria bacterium]
MKKTSIIEKKITLDVVVAGLKESTDYILEASEKELSALAKRFEVEKIHSLKACLTVYPGELIKIAGRIEALTRRQCVISLQNFDEKMKEEFEVFYADNPPAESDEIIDIIDKGRIHLGEIVSEQYGLALNPFPKKPGVKNPYIESAEEKQHPFANLKQILKK